MRSFDQRSHNSLGFCLRLTGTLARRKSEFSVGIGGAAQNKHSLRVGDVVVGLSSPVSDPNVEPVEYYRTSGLRVIERAEEASSATPPWHGVPPELPAYRQRGHGRLDPRTYEASCVSCIWGCRMPVEIIVDQWNPARKKYRFGTFCYGPKSCPDYRAGATRKVPGRKGMTSNPGAALTAPADAWSAGP